MTGMGVILPAREWTPACEELAEQVGENDENDDELIIVCDTEDDEVMEYHDPPEVKVVASGEPTGCSGKCNAVATGIEETESDIIILTDDDFEHGENWIRKVERKVEENGAISTYPIFKSQNLSGLFLEPIVTVFTLQVYVIKSAWGGTIGFHRDDVDIESLTHDLRRTVTDDALIGNHLNDITIDRSLARVVEVEGSLSSIKNRTTRFVRSVLYWNKPAIVFMSLAVLGIAVATFMYPLATLVGTTAVAGLTYASVGHRRWTFLLALPSFLICGLVLLYGLLNAEFEWGERRYRWKSRYDVEILDKHSKEKSTVPAIIRKEFIKRLG